MKTVGFSTAGSLKMEFLVCTVPCHDECEQQDCPNQKKEVKLLETVTFHLPEQQVLSVDAGFVFDGASIPRICWTSVGHPLEHRFIYAALLHDALYSSQLLPRETADQYFQTYLKEFAGVGFFTAWKMYTGVRLFGGGAWKDKTDEQIASARTLVHLHEVNE